MTAAVETARPGRGRVVELVGPAGAGKSTVFAALRSQDPSVEGQPTLRTARHGGALAAAAASSVTTLARSRALGRQVTVEQLRMMAYLDALPPLLGRRNSAQGPVVFDQGPIFFLTRPILMDERLARWRERTLERWQPLLDAVVWLDAPDDVLARRIDERAKQHALKGAPSSTASDVLGRARAVYEDMLARLEADAKGPVVLRFDTEDVSADEVAAQVLRTVAGACTTPS